MVSAVQEGQVVPLGSYVSTFRQRPLEVQAIRFSLPTRNRCFHFVTTARTATFDKNGRPSLRLMTPQGMATTYIGDWIVEVADGQFYVLRNDEFRVNYEEVQTWNTSR